MELGLDDLSVTDRFLLMLLLILLLLLHLKALSWLNAPVNEGGHDLSLLLVVVLSLTVE